MHRAVSSTCRLGRGDCGNRPEAGRLDFPTRLGNADDFLDMVRPDGLLAVGAARPPLRSGSPPRRARQRPTRRGAGLSNPARLFSGVRTGDAKRSGASRGSSDPNSVARPERFLRGLRPLGLAGARLALRATAIAAPRRWRRTRACFPSTVRKACFRTVRGGRRYMTFKVWCARTDSNRRPPGSKPGALSS